MTSNRNLLGKTQITSHWNMFLLKLDYTTVESVGVIIMWADESRIYYKIGHPQNQLIFIIIIIGC